MKKLLNVSIDDVSPHPMSSLKIIEKCNKILEEFPEIKFTLFIPTAYWRVQKYGTEEPLKISKFPNFCDTLRDLPKKSFEIGFHGHYHGIPNVSDNDELRDLSYDDSSKLIQEMIEEVKLSNLEKEFKKIIRPPAWRMSKDSIRSFKDNGFDLFSLSPDDYVKEFYNGEENHVPVVYFNVCPPFKELNLFDKTEIVYHACEWDKNYLDDQKVDELLKFLRYNQSDLEFCFIKELSNGKI